MKTLELNLENISHLSQTASDILKFANDSLPKPVRLFALYGQMGIGKTTLIKEICKQLGSHDNFSSPTYSVVNEYLIEGSNDKIYHIDLYRLKDLDEALSIGIEEYINSSNYCFIEWPELIEPLLPDEMARITMEMEGDIRKISIFMG